MGKIFLYSGEEEFLKREELERLKKAHGENTTVLKFSPQDEEFDIEKIFSLAKNRNLFSPHQIIVIKDIEKLSPKDLEYLFSYIKNPSEFTDLVLFTKFKIKKINNEAIWLNTLIKEPNVMIKDFSSFNDGELRRWIVTQINRHGKSISSSAVTFLISKLGNEISNLYQVIEKICLYVKHKKIVEQIDLETIIDKDTSLDIYKMFDALLDKDLNRSINILKNIQETKERPEKIIGILGGELRKIFLAKRFLQKGFIESEIKRKLNLYYSEKFFINLRKITSGKINRSLRRLLFVDYAIKTGKLEPFLAIEQWLLESFS